MQFTLFYLMDTILLPYMLKITVCSFFGKLFHSCLKSVHIWPVAEEEGQLFFMDSAQKPCYCLKENSVSNNIMSN